MLLCLQTLHIITDSPVVSLLLFVAVIKIINLFVYKDLLFFKLNNQAPLSCCQRLFVDPPCEKSVIRMAINACKCV